MPLELGTLLYNRYRIVEELGRGGMGAVYRGQDESLGVEVAIKENHFVSPEAERQFFREATLLASLRHLNLPRVTDHFVIPEEGQYLVMDYVPGDDARQLLERQGEPLPEADVLRWMGEILDAVNYLHTRPQSIIHRDIKPGNIMLVPRTEQAETDTSDLTQFDIRLIDFGIAKVLSQKHIDVTGKGFRSAHYGAPELADIKSAIDARADVFSVGVMMYQMLTKNIPRKGSPPTNKVNKEVSLVLKMAGI